MDDDLDAVAFEDTSGVVEDTGEGADDLGANVLDVGNSDLPARMSEELRDLHDVVLSLEAKLPNDVFVLLQSEALLDLALRFYDIGTHSFGDHLIDERDAFIHAFKQAIGTI